MAKENGNSLSVTSKTTNSERHDLCCSFLGTLAFGPRLKAIDGLKARQFMKGFLYHVLAVQHHI